MPISVDIDTLYRAVSYSAMLLQPKDRTTLFNGLTSWCLDKLVTCDKVGDVWVDSADERAEILAAHEKWTEEKYVEEE